MTTLSDVFEDYKKSNIGKTICIELEVARRDAYDMKTMFPILHPYCESMKIYEINNIHLLKTKQRKIVYDKMKEIYKDKFPVGNDTNLSGGVHFHAFTKPQGIKNFQNINFKLNFGEYGKNFIALPLFCKIKDYKFYKRPNGSLLTTNSISTLQDCMHNSRQNTGGLRMEFRSHSTYNTGLSSIEFRANNVVDTRIYGYYIGQLLLAELGIKLLNLSKEVKYGEERSRERIYWNVDELEGTKYDTEDQIKIQTNLRLLLMVLRKYGFKNSAKELRAYAKEYAIL